MWHSQNTMNRLIKLQASQETHLWPRHLFINNKSQSHDFRNWGIGGKAHDYSYESEGSYLVNSRPAQAIL